MANPKLAPASQSFMDELNASRERRPVPQAMQELERTLAGLERRLLDFDIEEEEPAEPAHHHAPQHITNSAAGLAEITENLRRRLDSRKEAHSLRTSLEDNFTRRLNEVFDQTAAGEREPDPEAGLRLERIENRLSDLTRQLDTAVAQHDSDLIYQKLGLLSQRIDALSDGSALPGSMAGQLAEQIGLLASRVAKVMDHLSQTDYHAFEERLDLIGRKLEAVEHRAAEPHPAVLDRIDCRFSELTERFNAQYASLHRDTGAIHALENRMDDLSEQISEGLRQAPPPAIDSAAIRNLEAQIADIARHLQAPVAELSRIGPRLDSIERSLGENRKNVLDAAREAAESAVAHVLEHGSQRESAVAQQLGQDMKSLEALARNTDERNTRTFETVHGTLVKIVDRLAKLEQDVSVKTVRDRNPAAEREPATAKDSPAAGPAVLFGGFSRTAPDRTEPGKLLPAKDRSETSDTRAAGSSYADVDPVDSKIGDSKIGVGGFDDENVPDLNAIMKRVREERRQRESTGDDAKEPARAANGNAGGKADLITAARRAAQMAAAESGLIEKSAGKDVAGRTETDDAEGTADDATDRPAVSFLQRQRKPILMAIGAVMIAMAGLQIGTAFFKHDGSTETTADTQPQQDAAPQATAKAETPAPAETAAAKVFDTPRSENTADIKTDTPAPAPAASAPVTAPPAPQPQAAQAAPAQASEPAAPQAKPDVAAAAPAAAPAASQPVPAIPADAGPAALREAAAKGDNLALYEIGNRYMEGKGAPANFASAAKWFEVSATRGFAPAQYRLGNMYEKGLGMSRDLEKAKDWYKRAAEQGNISAMHNLAVLYATGTNGAPDNVSAVRWFTDAAEHGVKDSQYNLGILAAKGLGMPVNLEDSYKWFALAANSGDKDAADKRDQIGRSLTPEQLERARNAVKLWKATPLDDAANATNVPDAWTDGNAAPTGAVDMKKAVRNIQIILRKNGFDTGGVDGQMGDKTRAAIAAFQKANGQKPTGEVDQKLVQLLLQKNK